LRPREKLAPVDQGIPLDEFRREMMATAVRCTGRTEEQLRALAEGMCGRAAKVERRHWAEEREPGSDDA
jgi:hypothetical protein